MLKQQLQQQLKESMLSKNAEKTSVLRMLISAITYYEIEKSKEEYDKKYKGQEFTMETQPPTIPYSATEEDVQTVIQKEAKKIRDSIEQFNIAGRQDLVDKETKELGILQEYLPTQMAEDEIRKIVQETKQQIGASSMQDMGKLMGALMPKVKGKADGSIVSNIVKEELSQ